MIKNIIITAALIALLPVIIHAETRKEKILIYNLTITTEKDELADAKKKAKQEERYDYYSTIIPHIIAKNLTNSNKFEIQQMENEFTPESDIGSDTFFAHMNKLSKDFSARYIIFGKAIIKRRRLSIELVLILPASKQIIQISRESNETGAELKRITEDLSMEIEQTLEKYREKSIVVDEVSPFMKVYKGLRGFSFGVNTGRFFIKGPFAGIYEDSEYISPYLSYDIFKWFSLTAEADYFNAENGNLILRKKSTMLLWGVSLNAGFTYNFFEHFGAGISA